MNTGTILTPSPSLVDARRIAWPIVSPAARVAAAEWVMLIGLGATSGIASNLLRGWGIPGSTVLQAVLPMAAGLALVPRRGAGLIMGSVAVGVSSFMYLGLNTGKINPSEMARLFLLGCCLEVGPARGSRRGHVWLWFIVAGLVANLAGFGLKQLFAQFSWEGLGMGRSLIRSFPLRLLSFAICGAVAGGISAVIFFRRSQGNKTTEADVTKD